MVAPGYAPIEQYYARGQEQGPWTDIYGLGATLYRAIAGVPPIDAIERSRGILGSTRDVLTPATVAGAGRYSEIFLLTIDHALMFNEKERPQSASAWAAEIRAVERATAEMALLSQTTSEAEAEWPAKLPPRALMKNHVFRNYVVAAAFGLAVGLLAAGYVWFDSTRQKSDIADTSLPEPPSHKPPTILIGEADYADVVSDPLTAAHVTGDTPSPEPGSIVVVKTVGQSTPSLNLETKEAAIAESGSNETAAAATDAVEPREPVPDTRNLDQAAALDARQKAPVTSADASK